MDIHRCKTIICNRIIRLHISGQLCRGILDHAFFIKTLYKPHILFRIQTGTLDDPCVVVDLAHRSIQRDLQGILLVHQHILRLQIQRDFKIRILAGQLARGTVLDHLAPVRSAYLIG